MKFFQKFIKSSQIFDIQEKFMKRLNVHKSVGRRFGSIKQEKLDISCCIMPVSVISSDLLHMAFFCKIEYILTSFSFYTQCYKIVLKYMIR